MVATIKFMNPTILFFWDIRFINPRTTPRTREIKERTPKAKNISQYLLSKGPIYPKKSFCILYI